MGKMESLVLASGKSQKREKNAKLELELGAEPAFAFDAAYQPFVSLQCVPSLTLEASLMPSVLLKPSSPELKTILLHT